MKKINPLLSRAKNILPYINEIDKTRYYSNYGPLYNKCENRIKQFLRLPSSISNVISSSGTSSILACLLLLKKNTKKRYVLVPSFSFYADIQCIILAGFEPIFVDVDPVEIELTEKILNPIFKNDTIKNRIAGIIIVSAFGKTVDLQKINSLKKKFNVEIIYDAANCFLNLKNKLKKLNFFICCSFHPTKMFPSNESGLIICQSKFKEDLKSILNFGIKNNKTKRTIFANGFNGKFSEYDASILLSNLDKINFIYNTYKKFSAIIVKHHFIKKYLLNDFSDKWISNNLILILKKNNYVKEIEKLKKKKINFYYPWGKKLMSDITIYRHIKKLNLINSKGLIHRLISINLPLDLKISQLNLIMKKLEKTLNV